MVYRQSYLFPMNLCRKIILTPFTVENQLRKMIQPLRRRISNFFCMDLLLFVVFVMLCQLSKAAGTNLLPSIWQGWCNNGPYSGTGTSREAATKDGWLDVSWMSICQMLCYFFFDKSCIFLFIKKKTLECLIFQRSRVNYLQGGKRKNPFSTSRIQSHHPSCWGDICVFSVDRFNGLADRELSPTALYGRELEKSLSRWDRNFNRLITSSSLAALRVTIFTAPWDQLYCGLCTYSFEVGQSATSITKMALAKQAWTYSVFEAWSHGPQGIISNVQCTSGGRGNKTISKDIASSPCWCIYLPLVLSHSTLSKRVTQSLSSPKNL